MTRRSKFPASSTLSSTDRHLWERVAETIRPLRPLHHSLHHTPLFEALENSKKNLTIKPSPKKQKPDKKQNPGHASFIAHKTEMLRPQTPLSFEGQEENNLAYKDANWHKKLRRAKVHIEAKLDLHGLNQDRAFKALSGFIPTVQRQGKRAILVVTGKGAGILKSAVPRWLNETDLSRYIVSYYRANPQDGGEGALYVVLKRGEVNS